ncbi:MAG: hypothetical protein ACI9KN_001315, partial [Gammaproteobacteria bacterium]
MGINRDSASNPECSGLALDNINRQTASRSFLIFSFHIGTGFA